MSKTKQKHTQAYHQKKLLIILLLLVCVPIEIYLFFNFIYISKIFPNIYLTDIYLGSMSKQQALHKLRDMSVLLPETIQLTNQSQIFTLHTNSVGMYIDQEKSVQNAFHVGRLDNPLGNLRSRLHLLTSPSSIPFEVNYDDTLLTQAIASISALVNQPTIPHTITIDETMNIRSATVSAGRSGKVLNETKLKEEIIGLVASRKNTDIEIPIEDTLKPVSNEKIEQTRVLANNLINKTLTLNFEENNWDLNDESLINFLSVYDEYDNEKIASWSGLLANTIERDPQNALFNFDGERVTEFKPAKPGVKLDKTKAIDSIKNGIQFLANSKDKVYSFSVPVIETQPKITTDKVNDLGIRELIGTGESWFYHSIASRIHNLTLASSKLHGILIPPGEEFSMLKILGEINAAQGYKPAYIIQNGRTVLGDGGGVCQTSTTLFRAALDAGLDIKTRFPHAYRVSYYEANYDIGVDASIFSPTADFTFINDTPGHILIQVTVDPKEMYLRYDFYGTSDGRVVERSKSRMWDQAPPPPDLYQDDPTLPVGVVKQVDWSAWGAKTAFDWKVTRNGEVIHEKTFYSTYRPWQAVYLRGTAQ